MKRDDLLFGVACWNADPFNIDNDDLLDEVWDEIQSYGFYEVLSSSSDYVDVCHKLDLSEKCGFHVYETNNHSLNFCYEF